MTARKGVIHEESQPLADDPDVGAALPAHELAQTCNQHNNVFIADIRNAAIKSDMSSMEHPFFALKAGDREVRTYKRHDHSITIRPGRDGCATIHDKDLWIFCLSQLMMAVEMGRKDIGRTLRFTARDYRVVTNKSTKSTGYERIVDALNRMRETEVETNIVSEGQSERFCLVHSWSKVIQGSGARANAIDVTLPEWLYRSVLNKRVLTLSPSYFNIRRPIDRRIYELARKHCGQQRQWICTIRTLYEKSGSTDAIRNFRVAIKALEKSNDLPDYRISVIDDDKVMFLRR